MFLLLKATSQAPIVVLIILYQEWHSHTRKMIDQDPPQKFVGSVGSAIAILRYLAHLNRRAGVASIARETGINVSTCFNILRTLASERLVFFDPEEKSYGIGLGVLEFSAPLLGSNQASLIRPELERLARERQTLIGLWQITSGERIILVDRVSATRTARVDMSLGSRLPAFVGAIGRCYAAHRNLDRAMLKNKFLELQWQSPPSFEEYERDVERARAKGFAFDLGKLFKGLHIAAALVVDGQGEARFGISGIGISGQLSRNELRLLAEDLRDTTAWISERLFGAEPRAPQAGGNASTAAGGRKKGVAAASGSPLADGELT